MCVGRRIFERLFVKIVLQVLCYCGVKLFVVLLLTDFLLLQTQGLLNSERIHAREHTFL